MAYGSDADGLGKIANALLLRLEYRGYDSTGAAFIDTRGNVLLRKAVGAPSKVCPAMGIDAASGQRFIGQVRWATRGSVSEASSQPHHVHCQKELLGAHNGFIDNLEPLKTWLGSRGHAIVSDNDGEVLIHLIEEHYVANQGLRSADLSGLRQAYAASGLREGVPDGVLRMIDALRKAQVLAGGAYSAVVADPDLPGIFAINSGSSLYAGVGRDEYGGFEARAQAFESIDQGNPARFEVQTLHAAGDHGRTRHDRSTSSVLLRARRRKEAGGRFRRVSRYMHKIGQLIFFSG